MNKSKIEWCDMTWNPITGCLHQCEYCYAKGIANRFKSNGSLHQHGNWVMMLESHYEHPKIKGIYDIRKPLCRGTVKHYGKDLPLEISHYPFGFAPTFHRYRLSEPAKTKKPQTVFVGSMADVFGEWIPDEWIAEIVNACRNAGVPVFLKDNLAKIWGEPLIQEFPWEVEK